MFWTRKKPLRRLFALLRTQWDCWPATALSCCGVLISWTNLLKGVQGWKVVSPNVQTELQEWRLYFWMCTSKSREEWYKNEKTIFCDFLNKMWIFLHDRTSWKKRMKHPPVQPESLSYLVWKSQRSFLVGCQKRHRIRQKLASGKEAAVTTELLKAGVRTAKWQWLWSSRSLTI